jgi:hypothetical protein
MTRLIVTNMSEMLATSIYRIVQKSEMVVVCRERMGYAVGGTASGRNGSVQWTGQWVDHAEGNESR